MSWVDLLDDCQVIKSIFSETPKLNSVVLHDVELNRDGARLRLRFDLQEFPQSPPKKWIQAKFNTVQIALDFYEISSLKLEGWDSNLVVRIDIVSENSDILLSVEGGARLVCRAKFAVINKLSAYQES